MHELSIATGVIDSVKKVVQQNNALRIKQINLVVGTSTAVIEPALKAAFDALTELDENALFKGAKFNIDMQESTSICLSCGAEFTHGIAAAQCPECKSFQTEIIRGHDVFISSIEIEEKDAEEDDKEQ